MCVCVCGCVCVCVCVCVRVCVCVCIFYFRFSFQNLKGWQNKVSDGHLHDLCENTMDMRQVEVRGGRGKSGKGDFTTYQIVGNSRPSRNTGRLIAQ